LWLSPFDLVRHASLIESAARRKKTIAVEVDQDGQAITYEDSSHSRVDCTVWQSLYQDAKWVKIARSMSFVCHGLREDGYVFDAYSASANEAKRLTLYLG
jgi:hypothetical protein